MRVLLDEHLNWRLIRDFDSDFEVTTVLWQGWNGKRNGELLRLANAVFDVLVTMDKNIKHQQNLSKYTLSLVVIEAKSNRLSDVQPAMPKVNQILGSIQPSQVIHITAL